VRALCLIRWFTSLACAGAFGIGELAAATVYEPSAYFSAADSPFYAGIQAGTIYLEDFEDHALNTPFVTSADYPTRGPFSGVNNWTSHTLRSLGGTSPLSVDADDGLNGDFLGFGGDSFVSESVFSNALVPFFDLRFTRNERGLLPAFVGVVITDPEDLEHEVQFAVVDGEGRDLFSDAEFEPDWGGSFPGDTRRHRFIGFQHENGIAVLSISHAFEIDHLQYGYAIPEPGVSGLLLVACALLRRRGRI
jgi:hypothetical protein